MSDRLRLREFRESDLDVLATMVAEPEQMTFYPRPKTGADTPAMPGEGSFSPVA